MPATVQAILAARIDRLPAEDKRLLETAAVIGQTVSFTLLEAVADVPGLELQQRLDHLRTAELLYQTRSLPAPEYAFKHALTHEVAYSTLLAERRRVLHAKVVETIEAALRRPPHRTRRATRPSFLSCRSLDQGAALHPPGWTEGGVTLRAPGGERLPRAGEGRARPSSRERVDLEQAIDVPPGARAVQWMLGEPRRALECLREAEALAERLGDERRRGRVYAFMTNIHILLGELDEALASGTRALAIAQNLGDLALRLVTIGFLESAHHHRGEHAQVVELARDNLAVLPPDWLYEYLGSATPPRDLRSLLAGPEPRSARPIRRSGRVRR